MNDFDVIVIAGAVLRPPHRSPCLPFTHSTPARLIQPIRRYRSTPSSYCLLSLCLA